MKSFSPATLCPANDDEALPPCSTFTIDDEFPPHAPPLTSFAVKHPDPVSLDETPLDHVRLHLATF